jgi:hypothetical protein
MRKALALLIFAALTAPAAGASPDSQQPEDGLYGARSGHGPTGASAAGFALSLTARANPVHLGTPIWVTVEVRNTSGAIQSAWFGSRHSSYVFTITSQSTGAIVPPNPHNAFGLDMVTWPYGGRPIDPGTSLYLPCRLDLLYTFTESGTYSVKVTDGEPAIDGKSVKLQSNAIAVTILP